MNEQEFTYAVRIIASAAMDNAPYGYLVAQIELIPGLLYVESERNPYTEGEWRWAMFVVGDGHPSNNKPLVSVLMTTDSGILSELRGRLAVVSALFEGSSTVGMTESHQGAMKDRTVNEALSEVRREVSCFVSESFNKSVVFASDVRIIASRIVELTHIVDNIALDTERRLRALERHAGIR